MIKFKQLITTMVFWLLGAETKKVGTDKTEVVLRFRLIRWSIVLCSIIFAILCVFTTWYVVGAKEKATVRTLGIHTDTVDPGFHFKLPAPFTKVQTTNVTEYHRMEIGFRTETPGPPAKYKVIPEEAFMLTGDANIATVEFVLQFRIRNPALWQFNFEEAARLLNYLAQSSMRLVIGHSNFDSIITDGRAAIQKEAEKELQSLCDLLELGVEIARINIQDALPPGKVGIAFKDVNNAKTDKDRYINEGTAHQNDVVPKAQGEASEITNIAKGEAAKRLNSAQGEVDRWLQVWEEFKKNPEIIKRKLVFEAMPIILKNGRVVIDKGSGNGVLKHLGLNNLMGETKTSEKTNK